jgi:hypothetical protein
MIGEPSAAWKLHDVEAHRRDRIGGGSWPTCDRCIERCVAFHDDHGIGHLVPAGLRRRLTEIAEARAAVGITGDAA